MVMRSPPTLDSDRLEDRPMARFTDDQIETTRMAWIAARKGAESTEAALNKQRAALKGMTTSQARGNYINQIRFDARRHEIRLLEEMLASDQARAEDLRISYTNMQELNRIEAEQAQNAWIDAIKTVYSEYDFRSWGGGMEISRKNEDGTQARERVSIYFPRPGYGKDAEVIPGGVNWSALGTQSALDARRYARLIETAAAIAEQANADGVVSGY